MNQRIKHNLEEIESRIESACQQSGRPRSEVRLIGVTKYVDAETTAQLVQAGCRDLGESRPQVLWDKSADLTDQQIVWHMIGHLQRNKVKRTIECCDLIHSVDSQRLIQAIETAAVEQHKTVDVLLEVNVSGESAKHGFSAGDLPAVFEVIAGLRNVSVKGLMCMAGLAGDLGDAKREFATLCALAQNLKSNLPNNVTMEELSMGMSGDFEAAIAEGATMVRVGSALFK